MAIFRKSTKPNRTKLHEVFSVLCKAVLAVLTIFILAVAFPLEIRNPLWYLKISQALVDYSMVLLFAISLAILGSHFASQQQLANSELFTNDQSAKSQLSFLQRLLALAFSLYVLLIPLQILAFGVHWQQSNQQVKQALKSAESNVENLRKRIRTVRSVDELRNLFGISPRQAPLGNPGLPALAGEQTRALQAVDQQLSNLRTRLKEERRTRLTGLSINTSKGILGAFILAFCLAKLRSWRPQV